MAEEPEASGGDPTTTNHAREWLSTTELLQPVHLGCFRYISHSLVPLCCVLAVHCSLELLECVQPPWCWPLFCCRGLVVHCSPELLECVQPFLVLVLAFCWRGLAVHCSPELLECVQPFLVLVAVLLQRVGCALQL